MTERDELREPCHPLTSGDLGLCPLPEAGREPDLSVKPHNTLLEEARVFELYLPSLTLHLRQRNEPTDAPILLGKVLPLSTLLSTEALGHVLWKAFSLPRPRAFLFVYWKMLGTYSGC